MSNTTGKHAPGSVKIAKVIINGKGRIKTEWGEKTAEGIADMIDNETHAPELLEALKYIVSWSPELSKWDPVRARALAISAIARAEGR